MNLRDLTIGRYVSPSANNPRIRGSGKLNWDGFRLDLRNRLTTVPTRFHNRDQPRDNLETIAAYLSNVISDAFKANYLLKLIRSETKVPWWNTELCSETRRLFNKARNSCLPLHWETFRNAQRRYSREIVRSKCSNCREFCESVESAPEASRLNRILSSDNHTQLP